MRRRVNLTIADRAERERRLALARVAPQPRVRKVASTARPIPGLELLKAGSSEGWWWDAKEGDWQDA